MAINKVDYGDQTLMDLTEDTVTEDKVLEGETFHDRSGVLRSGSLVIPVQDVEVNGESVVNSEKVAEIDIPTTDIQTAVDEFSTYNGGLLSSLKVSLSPNQDLHGYDSPWVGGAGKNKAPLKNKSGSGLTFVADELLGKMTLTGTATTWGWAPGIMTEINLPVGSYICSATNNPNNANIMTEWQPLGAITSSGITFNVTSNTQPVRVTWRVENGTTYNNVIEGLMIRSASETDPTFEPYENICPISGHTEVDLYNVGKNKLDPNSTIYNAYIDGITGIITSSSTDRTIVMKVNPSSNYVFTWNRSTISSTDNCRVSCYSELPIVGTTSGNLKGTLTESGSLAFNTNSNESWIAIKIGTTTKTDVTKTIIASMLEEGSSPTTYEPYLGHLYQVQIGSTVYGGYVDLVSGVMTATHKMVTLNGTETGYASVGGNYPQAYSLSNPIASDGKTYTTPQGWRESISNKYPKWSANLEYVDYGIRFSTSNSSLIYIYDARFQSDLSGFLNDLQDVPLQFCYELANPQTIQLTPQQIETLAGQNNLSTPLDGQNIDSVEYREVFAFDDVEKVVSLRVPISMLGTDESGRTTASQAYASGDYFYKDGYMCKALTSISAGATLTLNTNYSQGTLADVLKAIENT